MITKRNGIPGIRNARTVLGVLAQVLGAGSLSGLEGAWELTGQVLRGFERIRSIPDLSKAFDRVEGNWGLLAARQGTPSMEGYIRHVMAERRRRNFLEQRSYLRGVFLMTLHQSQGKQFDAVFIWRCNDGIVPHPEEIRMGDTSPSQQLLYVGITRARHLVRIYYEENQHAQPSQLIRPFI